jgi:hypothetical protein
LLPQKHQEEPHQTMNLVQEVGRVLDENYVSHTLLHLDSNNISKHHIITDQEKVFVKLLRPDTNPKSLQDELTFSFRTGYGTNPLLEDIQYRSLSGMRMYLSAWEWELRYPINLGMNGIQAVQAARELFHFHSFEKYPELHTAANDQYISYGEKLTSPSFKYLRAENQTRLRELFTAVIKPNTDLLTVAPEHNVVCHGNAIPDSLMMRQDYSVFWAGYEHVRSAPREYDLAHMYLHLTQRLRRNDLWEMFLQEYENLLGRRINAYALERFCALLLSRRALTLASQTLYAANEDKLASFLKELSPLVKGATVHDVKNFTHLH